MNKKAVFAGTFDPFTLGHLDVVKKASKTFDEIIIAVASVSDNKKCMFSLDKRIEIVKASVSGISGVKVVPFSGFLVDFMKENGVNVFVRGLRNSIDFEYEKNLLAVYKSQWNEVEGVYYVTDSDKAHISSSIVREMIMLGGDVKKYLSSEALKLI